MRFVLGMTCLVLHAAVVSAAEEPRVVDPSTSVGQLNEDVVFYCSFDFGVADADLSAGESSPRTVEGPLRFVEGRVGQAILIGTGGGGARIAYASRSVLDLGRPGAVSFWVRPHAWKGPKASARGYVRFFGMVNGPATFVIQRMGFDTSIRRPDRLMVGLFDLPRIKRLYIEAPGTEDWDVRKWHLIVVNWEEDGFELSIDGQAFERRVVPSGMEQEAFRTGGASVPFVIGNLIDEATAIDELTIYRRPLRPEEVARLFGD